MSNFCYQDANGVVRQVPVRYGDMTRQVAAILNKNSENVMPTAPFIACYIKDVKFNRDLMQDPTFVSKINIRERDFDSGSDQYLNTQGGNYTIERLMPTPYKITFNADLWTTNTDQKLQLWEQITVLFNPSIELQTTDNYIDWTSLSVLELSDGSVFETRTVPQGANNDMSIATLQFEAPIWITPPAKVKKLGIITKIIANIFEEPSGTGQAGGYADALIGGNIFGGVKPDAREVITPFNFGVLVLNNTAVLVPNEESNINEGWVSVDDVPNRPSWLQILDLYPGKFTSGLSQLRLTKPDNTEIVAYMTLNALNSGLMNLNFDTDTIPSNTQLADYSNTYIRGTIDAIVNPQTFNPNSVAGKGIDKRYLVLEDVVINQGENVTTAWSGAGPLSGYPAETIAHANDIIQWDGFRWWIIFNSQNIQTVTYITNAYTGIQYKWDGSQWSKSFEGVYTNEAWRMVL